MLGAERIVPAREFIEFRLIVVGERDCLRVDAPSIVVLMGNYRITLPRLDDGAIYERLAEKAAIGGRWTLRGETYGWPASPMYLRDRKLARSVQERSAETC